MNYDQLLFSELRLVSVSFDTAPLCEENLVKAMTVNEELLALGYTLNAKDITVLAASSDIDGFVSRVREYVGDVKAKPMYPDFPNQVMALDECVFRFHQMLHYFTTYGLSELAGVEVTRGWLPDVQDTEKTETDKALLDAKVLALIDSREKYTLPYARILSKTERMTDKEAMMVSECAGELSAEELTSVSIKFKQNMLVVFNSIFTAPTLNSEQKLQYLHALCQHTGDVWKCMDYALTRAHFHFKTSQKRLIVKLLESYPPDDFRGNLYLSNKKGSRTLLMLKFLDYNEYSRKSEYAKTVAQARDGRLRSWESGVKFLVERKAPEALEICAERPGMMLRFLTYLLRNGYKAEDIYDKLLPNAEKLKSQALVELVTFFSDENCERLGDERFHETVILKNMLIPLLAKRLAANETPIKGKKVYLNVPDFDLDLSVIRINDKSPEGGYIRSGLAYRIPETVPRLRFFIYWNDENRVDIDLHGSANNTDGSTVNIGWNSNYLADTMAFSGDITHSDAAEFIDLDLEKAAGKVDNVSFNINLFSGYPTFSQVDECFVGAMAVEKINEEVKLYDPKNCFFVHYLKSKCRKINYGYVDVAKRVIVFDGKQNDDEDYYSTMKRNNSFPVTSYLKMLFDAQGAVQVESPEEADCVLVMGKPSNDGELSLIDNNFFMESVQTPE